jgi:uroporphyrinogen decarboxylase
MTPRERVLESLNHREPDRVALDFSGHRCSGIAAIAYAKLRRFLGLKEAAIRVYDPYQQLALVDDDVLEQFGVDTVDMTRAFAFNDQLWRNWTLPDGTTCKVLYWALPERESGEWVFRSKSGRIIARMPQGTPYFEQAHFPLAENPSTSVVAAMQECMWTGIAKLPGPDSQTPEGLKRLAEGVRKFREETDKAVLGLFGGNLLEMGQFLYRNDNFFMLLASEPKRAHAFLDEVTELHLRNLDKFLTAVGGSIDVVAFSDDLGMQTGPLMSPRMYREFFKPRHKLLYGRVKQHAHLKVLLHCCGAIRAFLPDLIEAGVDAINPVQISCSGMDARSLKAEFGRDLVFWGGGCDTQLILPCASPKEVSRHVRQQVEILAPGGGFVFQQVHNIQANVAPQNIVAMFAALDSPRH